MDYYHVLVERSGNRRYLLRKDMSLEELDRQIVTPYEQGAQMLVQGATLGAPDFERLEIRRSQEPFSALYARVVAQQRNSNVIGGDYDRWAFNKGDDVTDAILKVPYAANTLSSDRLYNLADQPGPTPKLDSYFHVRIIRESNGTAEYFLDLNRERIEQRVSLPWKQGASITLSGLSFGLGSIRQIEIGETSQIFAELEELPLDDPYDEGWIPSSDRIRYLIFESIPKVTDDFIEGPHGHHVESPPKQGRLIELEADKSDPKKVFVVHGRDNQVHDGIVTFLESVGLEPIEWSEAKRRTNKTNPFIDEILRVGFSMARAVLVILTPDDDVVLRKRFHGKEEKTEETTTQGQARPNVLYEAGWAKGAWPERTVIIQIGNVKSFSDVGGMHIMKMRNTPEDRQALLDSLRIAGSEFSTENKTRWMKAGMIELTPALPDDQ